MKRWAMILALLAVTGSGWRVFKHPRPRPPPPPKYAVWPAWREDLNRLEARLILSRMHERERAQEIGFRRSLRHTCTGGAE